MAGRLPMTLTREQVELYWHQGYLVVPGLVPHDRLGAYEERFLEFVRGTRRLAPGMKIMRDVMVVRGAVQAAAAEDAVNKALSFEDEPGLYAYSLEPDLLAAVRCLIGKDLYTITTNFFNKPPGVDGRHPLHQDLLYFRIRPADAIVGSWTALTRTTRKNGCLAVVPESHRGGLMAHEDPDWEYVNFGFFRIAGEDNLQARLRQRLHLEMERGDTLLFHPLLIHGSGHNASNAPRRALSSHYASADCHSPDPDWRTLDRTRKIG